MLLSPIIFYDPATGDCFFQTGVSEVLFGHNYSNSEGSISTKAEAFFKSKFGKRSLPEEVEKQLLHPKSVASMLNKSLLDIRKMQKRARLTAVIKLFYQFDQEPLNKII